MTGTLAGISPGCMWSSRRKHVTSLEGKESSQRKYNIMDGTGIVLTRQEGPGRERKRGKSMGRGPEEEAEYGILEGLTRSLQLQQGAGSTLVFVMDRQHQLALTPCQAP